MDNAGNVTENGQKDVDQEICAAAALKEDTDGREKDGDEDLDNVAAFMLVRSLSAILPVLPCPEAP